MKIKKVLSIMLFMVMVSSLTACGNTDTSLSEEATPDTAVSATVQTVSDEETTAPTTAETTTVTDKAIQEQGLKVNNKGEVVDSEGNKVKKNSDGSYDVKTEDGKTVKVSTDEIKSATSSANNKSNNKKSSNSNSNSSSKSSSNSSSKSSSNSSSKSSSNNSSNKNTSSSSSTNVNNTNKSNNNSNSGNSTSSSSNKNNSSSSSTSKKTWHEAEYEYINHPAEYKDVWVVDKKAYTYEEPVFEKHGRTICNDCGADITDMSDLDATSHIVEHALNGGKGSYHDEWVWFYYGTQNRVTSSSDLRIIDYRNISDDYRTEKKSSGAEIVYHIITVSEEGHWEKQKVKDAWTEKKLVREAGYY